MFNIIPNYCLIQFLFIHLLKLIFKMKNTLSTFVAIFFAGIALQVNTSCNNAGQKASGGDSTSVKNKQLDSALNAKKEQISFKFQTMEVNLPDHLDVVRDISSHQVLFKQELTNPANSVEFYTTAFKKEVNMGIYGVDIMYVNFYSKNQDLLNYFNTIQKLAKDLNFDNVFNRFADRFKSHSNEKDTVINIVDSVFNEVDNYLNKNDRYISASHIFAGSLIEVN